MSQGKDYFFSETDEISISAYPELLSASSDSESSVWAYYFCFENNSNKKIQIVGKDWNITDDKGNMFHDNSDGFKGEIPELEPGEYFEFMSELPLSASNAVFYGSCKVALGNDVIDIKMPTFNMSNYKSVARVIN